MIESWAEIAFAVFVFGIGVVLVSLGINMPRIHGVDNVGDILSPASLMKMGVKIVGIIFMILAFFICYFLSLGGWLLLSWGLGVVGFILISFYGYYSGRVGSCDRQTYAKAQVLLWSGIVLLLISIVLNIHIHINILQGGG